MAKKWYVIHTYSGQENSAAENLLSRVESMGREDKIVKVQIPTENVTQIKSDGSKQEAEKKIFPGYILVRMEMDDSTWAVVRNTPGITGFVGTGGKPNAISRDEYNKIMKSSDTKAPTKTSADLEVGQSIKVISGPLEDFDGTVTEVIVSPDSGTAKVKANVSIFGRETSVELSFDQVEKIS